MTNGRTWASRTWSEVAVPDGYGNRSDEALMTLVEILDGSDPPDLWTLRRTARTVLRMLEADGRAPGPDEYDLDEVVVISPSLPLRPEGDQRGGTR